jgi:hypothetical protein
VDKFFLVGCPRSGTTMLQQALNRHSRIAIPPETKFFFSFLGHSRRAQARHVRRLNEDLGINLAAPARRLRDPGEARAFYEEMARQYLRRVRKEDVAYFGEKTPEHTGHLPRIHRLFPGAKIIVLVRDGRDVASSLSRMPWMPPDVYVTFAVWLYYARLVRKAREEAWPGLYFLRYEDIVAAPPTALAALLDFLGLPYEPAVAEGWGNEEGVPQRERAWKGRAMEKITAERVGVFRHELDARQVEILERLGGLALRSFGYELVGGGEAPLPAALPLRLAWGLSQFAYRLPRRALWAELLCRLLPNRPHVRPPTASLDRPTTWQTEVLDPEF